MVSGVAVDQPTVAFFDFPSHASFQGLLPASHILWSIRPVPLCRYGFRARRARARRPAMTNPGFAAGAADNDRLVQNQSICVLRSAVTDLLGGLGLPIPSP